MALLLFITIKECSQFQTLKLNPQTGSKSLETSTVTSRYIHFRAALSMLSVNLPPQPNGPELVTRGRF